MPLNINFQQIFLHLFNFTILFGILYFLLYGPVKSFMDKRREFYQKQHDDAQAELDKAAALKSEYEEKLANAAGEIAGQRDAIYKEATDASANIIKDAEERAADIVKQARKNAEADCRNIMRKSEAQIKEIVVDAVEKITSSAGSTSEAFDQFLAAAQRGSSDD